MSLKKQLKRILPMKISLFYKNITILDYAYLSDQFGVVGHSLKVHAQITGSTNDEYVIYDFSLAKKKLKPLLIEIAITV